MDIIAIGLCIIFAIGFPTLLQCRAIDGITNGGSEYHRIYSYFDLSGFYLFLFIAFVIFSTLLIVSTKNKTLKFASFGFGIVPFAYYIYVFTKVFRETKNSQNIAATPSFYILLMGLLFGIIVVTNAINILLFVLKKDKKEESDKKVNNCLNKD